jgi:hypothetical protein
MDLIVVNIAAVTGLREDACKIKMSANKNGLGDFLSLIRQLPDISSPSRKRIVHASSGTIERRNAGASQLPLNMNGDADQGLELIVMTFGLMIAEAPHSMHGRQEAP